MEKSESRLFKVISFITVAFILGFAIANLVYYVRLRGGVPPTNMEITSMIWINAILLLITSILFIWSLIRLLTTADRRAQLHQKTSAYLDDTTGGFF